MTKIMVILGSTSTGKTDLALKIAKKFNGELIACDSRQVYCGLDIGTGKLPGGRWRMEDGRWKKKKGCWEIDEVKIWLYDVVDLKKQYTVADYVKDVNKVIDEISRRGKLPIIVGGTGLYLKALLEGLSNLAVPVDLRLRKELMKFSLDELQKKLQEISLQRWGKMNNSDRQNSRRLIRAIEIVILNPKGEGSSQSMEDSSLVAQNDILKIGLTAPREILYQRIDERVVDRINQGIIEEAEKLHLNDLTLKRMRQLGLEYGVLADYLEGKIKDDGLIKVLQGKIHDFARRQITWFKKEKNVSWFDISHKNYVDKVENLVAKWYDIL